ncbi:acyl-CoA dehydrogenase family protein [Rhodococcus sp. CSLK01-03]|uniref:Acyl-CoA dehydrogenase family protein n=1 Tax=Rhodococcus indonesiensis TaxID=3055869 RepID=A0ABT7RHV1_9NOCA|nr:acyl-CoA dehydrogenase family protein [Rhodococcus indonesiensis]MDM7487215.1 acyl-CoA dehydrogenase family protein [Rhodococcus indonesiensis]
MSAVSLERTIYESDHDAFRETARRFAEREVAPHLEQWAAAGRVDRELYRQAGKLGLLGVAVPERFGGGGIDDFRFGAVLIEELARVGAQAVTIGLSGFNDLVAPYFTALGTDEQNHRWLAPMVAGEAVGAIAMTEPGAGSDLAAVTTTAIPDGDHFVLDGSKIFISNGILADTIIVVAKTDPAAGKNGVSLLVVEDGMPGFTKNGPLDKVGLSAQDTAELVFDNVRVPRANLLGEENKGFGYLRHNLPQERLSIAVTSMALMTRTFETALRHATDRRAFGQRIADFQANRFYLAELATEIEIAQVFVDRCILDAAHGRLDEVTAAMAKWWVTELHLKVVHRAVQLHGGYGFMKEYDVARDYLDSRAGTLYGGTTEIMKEIVGRRLTRP